MNADDELLTELSTAIRSANDVPASFLAVGKAAYAWRTIGAELATLTHDSLDEAVVSGTRADAELRALTFVAGELTIELEVTEDALVGQVIPAQPGQIGWEGPKGRSEMTDIEDIGWFAIRPAPTGPVRLHLRTASGVTVRTEWTTL
jgi:hypothetical protein